MGSPDALAVVRPPDGLGDSRAQVNDFELGAALELVTKGYGICDDDLGEAALVKDVDGVAAEDAIWLV